MSTEADPPPLSDQDVARLDHAVADTTSWREMSAAMRGELAAVPGDALAMVACAFDYLLDEPRADEHDGPYASMMATEQGSYPPPPAEAAEPLRAAWRQAGERSSDARVRARLHDLLLVAMGTREGHAHGRAAASGLADLAEEESWAPLDRAASMARAVHISQQLGDRRALQQLGPRAIGAADALLALGHPGPPAMVIRALLDGKASDRPDGLQELLGRMIAAFEGGPNHVVALGLAARGAPDDARRRDLHEQQVDLMAAQAERAEGLTRAIGLQRALERARELGLKDRADRLLTRLQGMSTDDLQFQSVTVSTQLDGQVVERAVDHVAGSGARDLDDALSRIGAGLEPPGGSRAKLRAEAQRGLSGILGAIGHTVYAPGSAVPVFVAASGEDRLKVAYGQGRQRHADYVGTVLFAPALHRAVQHHSRPTHDELTALWTTELIGPVRAERIARALELFWDGEPDASAHLLVPRLEDVLRDLLQAAGGLIRKAPKPGQYAGVVTLGAVIRLLRQLAQDDDWTCYLEDALVDPLCLNLRNLISHGLVDTVGEHHAALLLQIACTLREVKTEEE